MRALLPLAMVVLAGCGDRRTFDDKFNDTQAELERKSAELDRRVEEADRNEIEAGNDASGR